MKKKGTGLPWWHNYFKSVVFPSLHVCVIQHKAGSHEQVVAAGMILSEPVHVIMPSCEEGENGIFCTCVLDMQLQPAIVYFSAVLLLLVEKLIVACK